MVSGAEITIYLDTSALNRIFDDQSQIRIFLETSSVLVIFMFIENKIVDIASSDVLLFENIKIPIMKEKYL